MAVWTEVGQSAIRGQVIAATGTTRGEQFVVNTTEGTHALPAVAAGTLDFVVPMFVVVWLTEASAGRAVVLQRFRADGEKIAGEIRVNTTDVSMDHAPAVARLVDGNFVISWVSADLTDGIRARIYAPDGTPLESDFRVATSEGVHVGPVGIGALQNNSFVIAWQGGTSFASTSALLQTFGPEGARIGPEKRPNFVGFTGDMAVAGLSSAGSDADTGRFVIVYSSSAGGSEERLVVGHGFSPDGEMGDGFNVTHRSDQSIGLDVTVTALPGASFVVAWTERKVAHVGDTTANNAKAAVCSEATASQPPSGAVVSTSTSGDQRLPCVVASLGELGLRVAFAWLDDSVSGADSANRSVQARVLSADLRPVEP